MFKNDARYTRSGDEASGALLTLVKPEGPLYDPAVGDHLFKSPANIPVKAESQGFKPGLPEKEISLPDPLVQQAIARTLAGIAPKGFQPLTPKTMAEVAEIAKTAPRSKAEALAQQEAEKTKALAIEAQAAEKARQEAEAAEQVARQEQLAAQALVSDVAEDTPESGILESGIPESTQDLAASSDLNDSPEQSPLSEQNALPEQVQSLTQQAEASPEQIESSNEQADASSGAPESADGGGDRDGHTSAELAQDSAQEEALASAPADGDVAAPEVALPEGMQMVSAQDIQQMFDEAFEQGRQAGLEESKGLEDETFQKGYDEGYAKAEASVRDELQAEVQLAVEDIKDLASRMAESARDTESFYAPLLKLSMHLAEQLVRGELSLSTQAIERLIQTALEEFEHDPSAPVSVRLNPEDLERFKSYGAALPKNMTLRAEPALAMGSVRVQMNGALIEDLIEHRAAALWNSLTKGLDAGSPPPSFLQNIALIKEAFNQVDSVIEAGAEPQGEPREL